MKVWLRLCKLRCCVMSSNNEIKESVLKFLQVVERICKYNFTFVRHPEDFSPKDLILLKREEKRRFFAYAQNDNQKVN
jgi:hypothetical protein